jgi:hypothetical protein
MSKKPFTPNKHFRKVIECLGITPKKPIQPEHRFIAFLLADGFGRHTNCGLTEADVKALDYYYDWSHFRDSTETAIEAVAKYLKSVGY